MKELYEKAGAFESLLYACDTFNVYDHTCTDYFMRKLLWYFAALILGRSFDYAEIADFAMHLGHEIVLEKGDGDSLADVSDAMSAAYTGSDAFCLYDGSISNATINKISGKHWVISMTADTIGYGDGFELYFFDDFKCFLKRPFVVTDNNLALFKRSFKMMISDMFPSVTAEDIEKIYDIFFRDEKRKALYFEEKEVDGRLQIAYQASDLEDAATNTIDYVEELLSCGWKKGEHASVIKEVIVNCLKSNLFGNTFQGMSDGQLLKAYEALHANPLLVQLVDTTYLSSIPGYILLRSDSLPFICGLDGDALMQFPEELQQQIVEFQSLAEDKDELFPFFNNGYLDFYMDSEVFIMGAFATPSYFSGLDNKVKAGIYAPSLTGLVLLQWADAIYDKCMAYITDAPRNVA